MTDYDTQLLERAKKLIIKQRKAAKDTNDKLTTEQRKIMAMKGWTTRRANETKQS